LLAIGPAPMPAAELNAAVAKWARESFGGKPHETIVQNLSTALFEHYQCAWSASSRAERLVLVHLALGRAVSLVAAAGPLSALVRRGLVKMDRGPCIMNRSFETFVLNAETPAKVADYQRGVARGTWQLAQIPLLLFVPIGLVALAYALLDSGLGLEALAPLVTVATPALLQTLFGTRRAAA
jgi:hypothetical protein